MESRQLLVRSTSSSALFVCLALGACSQDNPGPAASTRPHEGSAELQLTSGQEREVRFEKKAPAKVWLHFDCRLTGGDFEMKGTLGFSIPEAADVQPVPLTITRKAVSAEGLPRTRDGFVGLRERTFEGAPHLAGYAYLFDLPATSEAVTIQGSVTVSGALCADGLGQYNYLFFTQ